MSFDPIPASTQVPPPPESALTSVSFADFAHATSATPRAASVVLDVARHHAFTGEITFLIDPLVRVYLDGGTAYLAEVDGSPSVSQQLLDARVIESPQLERGIVRVGDLEHLGRLFDRDESIDRDAVMVVVEHHTAQLVQLLCESVVSAIEISAYRHHPSGVHRWFVAPIDSSSSTRPLSDVAQIDRSVVDELPGLGPGGSDIEIEWTEPDPSGLGVPADSLIDVTASTDAELQAELDRFDADEADWAAGVAAGFEAAPNAPMSSPLGEFHIVWPDGTTDPDLVNAALTSDVADNDEDANLVPPEAAPPSSLEPPAAQAPAPTVQPPAHVEADDAPLLTGPPPPTALSIDAPDAAVTHAAPVDVAPADEPGVALLPLLPHDPVAPASADDVSDDLSSTDASFNDHQPEIAAAPLLPRDPVVLAPTEPIEEVQSDAAATPPGVIAPLVLDEIPQPDAAIPEDVAAAVKRALAAIDEASSNPIALPQRSASISLPLLKVPAPQSLDAPAEQAPAAQAAPAQATPQPAPPVVSPPPPAPLGFAPPTPATRAESMYDDAAVDSGAITAEAETLDPQVVQPFDDIDGSEPGSGSATVVFVDEAPAPSSERRGALRRLISSLRSNDEDDD